MRSGHDRRRVLDYRLHAQRRCGRLPVVGHHDGRAVPRCGPRDVPGKERRPECRAAGPGPGTVHGGPPRGGARSLSPPGPGAVMLSNTGVAWRAWPVRAMWLVLAAYVAALALHGVGWGPNWTGSYSTLVNNWVGLTADWLPPMVCWVAISRVGFRRLEVVFAAAAVGSYAVGDTYYTVVQAMTGSVPFPSAGDVAYLGFCVLLMAAIAGIAAIRGVRVDQRWVLLIMGLLAYAAADVVYALQVTAGTYVVGTLLDAGWSIGLTPVSYTHLRAHET